MTAIAHSQTAVQIHALRGQTSTRADRLRLLRTDDGWSLVGPEGEVVFHALGVSGRRRCLAVARERGVLAVFS